jgi:hypothetical protein
MCKALEQGKVEREREKEGWKGVSWCLATIKGYTKDKIKNTKGVQRRCN